MKVVFNFRVSENCDVL